MGLSRRQFTKEFKLAAIQQLETGARLAEVARAFEVNPSLLHRWRREFRQGPGNVFPGLGKRRWEEGQVAQLERKIGQQALEIDFLKGCLQRIDELRKRQALAGKTLSTRPLPPHSCWSNRRAGHRILPRTTPHSARANAAPAPSCAGSVDPDSDSAGCR